MPIVMKASERRIQKTFRVKQETLDIIELFQQKEGLSQGKVIDEAIQLLAKEKKDGSCN